VGTSRFERPPPIYNIIIFKNSRILEFKISFFQDFKTNPPFEKPFSYIIIKAYYTMLTHLLPPLQIAANANNHQISNNNAILASDLASNKKEIDSMNAKWVLAVDDCKVRVRTRVRVRVRVRSGC